MKLETMEELMTVIFERAEREGAGGEGDPWLRASFRANVVAKLEEEFDLTIEEADSEKFVTPEAVSEFLARELEIEE